MTERYIPAGHNAVSPYFITTDAPGLIDFIKAAFDGQEIVRMAGPDGVVKHCSLRIGDSVVMVGARAMAVPNSTHVYVPDVDGTYGLCLGLGASSLSAPTSFDYGDRSAGVRDPFGNTWWIGSHLG
jgi:uncharacterized glyoxalase superfamily protein PhnB